MDTPFTLTQICYTDAPDLSSEFFQHVPYHDPTIGRFFILVEDTNLSVNEIALEHAVMDGRFQGCYTVSSWDILEKLVLSYQWENIRHPDTFVVGDFGSIMYNGDEPEFENYVTLGTDGEKVFEA